MKEHNISAAEKDAIIKDTEKILNELNESSRYTRITDTKEKAKELYPHIEKKMLDCMKEWNIPGPPALNTDVVLDAMEEYENGTNSTHTCGKAAENWEPPKDEPDTSFRNLMTCTA